MYIFKLRNLHEIPVLVYIKHVFVLYANHEDMVIVYHRSNFIYEILKVESDNLNF